MVIVRSGWGVGGEGGALFSRDALSPPYARGMLSSRFVPREPLVKLNTSRPNQMFLPYLGAVCSLLT